MEIISSGLIAFNVGNQEKYVVFLPIIAGRSDRL